VTNSGVVTWRDQLFTFLEKYRSKVSSTSRSLPMFTSTDLLSSYRYTPFPPRDFAVAPG
jgi:hypothetical protein